MNSDPISESTPKRRRIDNGYQSRTYDSGNDSGDELFEDYPDTVATVPIPPSQRPSGLFAQTMASLQSPITTSRYNTQPTQMLNTSQHRDSQIQVARSSPPSSPSPRRVARAGGILASAMAPPGTAFRRPMGIQKPPPPPEVIDLSLEDPPINHSSDDDDEDDMIQASIKPTKFTKGRQTRDSSPAIVQESPQTSTSKFQNLTSKFAYNAIRPSNRHADEMSSAYGGPSRIAKPPHQTGPARAQPIMDRALEDILDNATRDTVQRMQSIFPNKPINVLEDALHTKKGNYTDALQLITELDDKAIDLTSSDLESNAGKPGARPISKKPSAKQEVRAPTRTIQEKYSTQVRSQLPKSSSQPQEISPKPRRRLMQGRKRPSSPARSPSPPKSKPDIPARQVLRATIDLDSGSESGVEPIEEEQSGLSEVEKRLLGFFNTCSAQDLADLANEKEATAEFILTHKPFKTLDEIRLLSDAQPTKSGRKSAKKAIGDRIVDVCEEMWEGYEAVDELVEQCESLGKPLNAAMKNWGIDLSAAVKTGEMAFTSLEEAHDSGIGTPSSSITDDEAGLTPSNTGKKNKLLKQPSIMDTKDVVMKDYQLFGLNWLNLLWSQKLSCILADDMGLGKTCQVISFLAHLRETEFEGTHLVVVPGSTLENWIREFRRFCPTLVVQPYYGSQAEREEQRLQLEDDLDSIDVIVTTYDIAVGEKGDNKFLRKVVRPNVCVFDEGHVLKNSKSKRHQQLMRIPADFRLLLTGTPLQNNLQELASLLNFILPKIFDEKREKLESIFKYKATTKDADHAALLSTQRITRARSMMAPFILRRKKQQVLRDIPAKHCRVELCDMVPFQRDFYERQVQSAIDAHNDPNKGRGGKSSVHMMALRLAALHPLLSRNIYTEEKLRKLQKILIEHPNSDLYGNREDLVWKYLTSDLKGGDYGIHKFCAERADYIPSRYILKKSEWMSSGKIEKLQELLEKFIANGDRVLIFSQFTSMMDIMEAVFETLSIKFMRLDGSTEMARRQDIIDQFTADESIPVFMLSTKAGGAGINLACANKVVIMDSSFNPQEDVQAENRAHRVGQKREVEVVRLVTKGTIEEQIHALGESKLALDNRVAGEGVSTSDEKAAEKDGEKLVEKMFFGELEKRKKTDSVDSKADLKDQFRNGLKSAGLDVGAN